MIEESEPMNLKRAKEEARRFFGQNADVAVVTMPAHNRMICLAGPVNGVHTRVYLPPKSASAALKLAQTWEAAFENVLVLLHHGTCPVCNVEVNVFAGLQPSATAEELKNGKTGEGPRVGVPERHRAPCGYICACGGATKRDFQKMRVHTSMRCMICSPAPVPRVDVPSRKQ